MLKYLFITAVICFIINMPIGYSLGVASMAFVVFNGLPLNQWVLVPQRIAMSINSFPLLAIPYFMVAGAVMEMGGVSRRIINLASAIVGHIKGGIAQATKMAKDLRENYKIFCSVVTYPVIPKGMIIFRIIPTAAHTMDDVNYTLNAFTEVKEKLAKGFYDGDEVPNMAIP